MQQPKLALSLAQSGADLYAHAPAGWVFLGRASFDKSNLGSQMAVLRRIAEGELAGARPDTLLLVPEDQVLWRQSPRPADPEDPARISADIRAELDGLTPYALEDLRFDWRLSETGLAQAVIALETLEEAERFARAHGFDPIGVAASDGAEFPGTAWFGLTRHPQAADGREVLAAPSEATIVARPEEPLLLEDEALVVARGRRGRPRLGLRQALPFAALGLVAATVLGALLLPGEPAPQITPEPPKGLRAAQQAAAPEVPPISAPVSIPAAGDAVQQAPDPAPQGQLADMFDMLPVHTAPRPRAVLAPGSQQDALAAPPAIDLIPPSEAIALERADTALDAPELAESMAPPPPQGQSFDVDEQGFVRASNRGSLAPGGYVVIAGQPQGQPGQRPEIAPEDPAAEPPGDLNDPLAQTRPQARPGDLAERFERLQFNGRSRAELAAERPQARPNDRAAAFMTALAAREAARVAEIAAQEAAAEAALRAAQAATQSSLQTASAQTPRPKARPAAAARRAQQAAARSQQRAVAAASTAAIQSQPKSTPQKALSTTAKTPQGSRSAPNTSPNRAPTQVAKKATDSNEISLRKVNLLGTFGKPGSLRALVMMPGGKVRNVSVGDRVDGGRVVAIGQGELRYTKGGRSHVLRMPKG